MLKIIIRFVIGIRCNLNTNTAQMYRIFSLFLFFAGITSLSAQVKAFRFIDSETYRPIADADVYTDSVFVAATSYNGNVKVDLGGEFKNLTINHIAYEKCVIPHDSLLVKKVYTIKKQAWMLDEVIVDSEIKKDSVELPVTNPGWGSKTATFIPHKNDNYISELQFRVINIGGIKGLNYLPFKANLYQYDTVTNMPGKPLLEEDILVENPDGNAWAVADVSSYKITVPKEGIFIVFIIPPFEEGLYERDFIQANFGTISAVPALKLSRADKNHYSFRYDPYFSGNGFVKEWKLTGHRYYKMDVKLEKDN